MCRGLRLRGCSGTGDGRSGHSLLGHVSNLLRGLPHRRGASRASPGPPRGREEPHDGLPERAEAPAAPPRLQARSCIFGCRSLPGCWPHHCLDRCAGPCGYFWGAAPCGCSLRRAPRRDRGAAPWGAGPCGCPPRSAGMPRGRAPGHRHSSEPRGARTRPPTARGGEPRPGLPEVTGAPAASLLSSPPCGVCPVRLASRQPLPSCRPAPEGECHGLGHGQRLADREAERQGSGRQPWRARRTHPPGDSKTLKTT